LEERWSSDIFFTAVLEEMKSRLVSFSDAGQKRE
jgi:hypothetical protein